MRNRYAGICYRCGKKVEPNQGHFERYLGHWRVQHANCAIENRVVRYFDKEKKRWIREKQ